jgi:hypothetical protein
MSLRDRIDPIRLLSQLGAAVFVLLVLWLFLQEW